MAGDVRTYLCVGGPMDGQYRAVLWGQTRFRVAIRMPFPRNAAEWMQPVAATCIEYVEMPIPTPEGTVLVWAVHGSNAMDALKILVSKSSTVMDALTLLVSGYRP